MIHFQDMIFFSGLSKFFLCAYRSSILNSSLVIVMILMKTVPKLVTLWLNFVEKIVNNTRAQSKALYLCRSTRNGELWAVSSARISRPNVPRWHALIPSSCPEGVAKSVRDMRIRVSHFKCCWSAHSGRNQLTSREINYSPFGIRSVSIQITKDQRQL